MGKTADKLFVETAVCRDVEVPKLPVHQLNISARGAVYAQAPGQSNIQHGSEVGTSFELRRQEIAHIAQYHAATALEAGRGLRDLDD